MGWTVGLCILLGGPHLAVSWGLIDCARDEEYLLININGLRPTIAQQEMMVMVTAALALLVFVGVLWRRARRPQAAVEPATAGRQQASERRSGVAGLIPALIAQGVLVGAVPLAPLLLGSTHYWMDVPVGFVTIVELSTMGAAAFFVRIPDSLWKRLCLFPIAGLAATAPFFFISLILFAVTHFPTP